MKNKIQEAWDKAARGADCNYMISPTGKDEKAYWQSGFVDAERILKLVENGHTKTYLDYGCGNGRVALALEQFVKKIYCADFSPAMLKQIDSKKIPNVKTVLVDEKPFVLPEKVDVAYSIAVFIHNPYIYGKEMLRDIANNVKPGGLLLLEIPLYEIPTDPRSWIDVGTWTADMLMDAIKQAECEVVKCFTNFGEFSYSAIGENHSQFQILRKL